MKHVSCRINNMFNCYVGSISADKILLSSASARLQKMAVSIYDSNIKNRAVRLTQTL